MTSVASLAPSSMTTSTASMTLTASLTSKLPKMLALYILSGFLGLSHMDSLFLWDWSLKIQFSVIFGTLTFRGCGGQPLALVRNIRVKSQMPITCLRRKINKIIDPFTPQKQFKKHVSIWDTLYSFILVCSEFRENDCWHVLNWILFKIRLNTWLVKNIKIWSSLIKRYYEIQGMAILVVEFQAREYKI